MMSMDRATFEWVKSLGLKETDATPLADMLGAAIDIEAVPKGQHRFQEMLQASVPLSAKLTRQLCCNLQMDVDNTVRQSSAC